MINDWLKLYFTLVHLNVFVLVRLNYCKTRFFRVPFISRAWQVRENNGP